jgi:hypothetical protein
LIEQYLTTWKTSHRGHPKPGVTDAGWQTGRSPSRPRKLVSASDVTLERSEERVNLWALPMEAGLLQRSRHPVQLTNGSLSYRNPVASHDGTQLFALGLAKRGELVRYDARNGGL